MRPFRTAESTASRAPMNAIVLIALKRPYTFVVLAILILIFGGRAALRTPTDIFPNIGIPVVAVVWTYNGLTPEDMSGRVVYYYERALTTTVSNIEHIESQSLYGRGIVKIFFQPGTDVAAAQAQVAAISQTVLKQMPAGITPPLVLTYNASSVPVLDLQISSDQMTGAELYDMASNLIRPLLVSVPGVAVPSPYGGTSNNVEVDLDQQKLLAYGLSAQDVSAALAKQDIVLPAGDQKIGAIDFLVETNAQPVDVATFNSLPIKQVGNTVVTVGDVAHVYLGGPPQTNAVLVHGHQAVLLEVLEGRRCIDSRDRRGREGKNTRDRAHLAEGREDHRAERCLDLRQSFGRGRRPGDGDGGRADRVDRPAVPGLRTLDLDRRDLDPAVDPVLDPGSLLVRGRPSTS